MIKTRVGDCTPTGPDNGGADVHWREMFSPGGRLRADSQRSVFTAPKMSPRKSLTHNEFR